MDGLDGMGFRIMASTRAFANRRGVWGYCQVIILFIAANLSLS